MRQSFCCLQLPGANAGKPDVAGAAKQAVKKSPLGFTNVGDFAFDLPGSNVSKDDLPNNVKPLEAKGLKDAPPNKTPSLPPLPQVIDLGTVPLQTPLPMWCFCY